jgi:hypothetical protein
MITPTLLHARSLYEPSAEILHAGISEGATGQPAILPYWSKKTRCYTVRNYGVLPLGTMFL